MRKAAHMTEFAVLFLLLWRALRRHLESEHSSMMLAGAISLAYAASDEWHQTFVNGRTGTIRDVGFDLAGILLAWLVINWRLNVRKRSRG